MDEPIIITIKGIDSGRTNNPPSTKSLAEFINILIEAFERLFAP